MYLGRPVTDEQSIIDEAGPAALTPTLRLAHRATSTQSRSQFSAQLAAALASLATGGGFDVLGGLQNFARLDRLALGTDNASGTTVSGA